MKKSSRKTKGEIAGQKAGENKLSVRRLISVILTVVIFLSGTFLLCIRKNVLLDEALAILTMTSAFLLVFILVLRNDRKKDRLSYNGTSYRKMIIIFLVCFVLEFIGTMLPDFFFPIMPMAFLLTSVMDGKLSLSMTLFFAALFSIVSGSGIFVLLCYIILGTVSSLIADYLKDEKFTFFTGVIIFCMEALIPCMFIYLSYKTLSEDVIRIVLAEGLICVLLAWILFPLLVKIDRREAISAYEVILDEDYSLAQDMRRYSLAEFVHARRVRNAAGACAALVKAKVHTASAGGFYYRLGVMEGAPVIENAVKTAIDHCFPEDVVEILYEYSAEKRLPSTVESAIVHMADQVVSKLEVLDRDMFSSEWNQSMVIYQTLNSLSSAGTYDHSGVSINQFLRIRDHLAKTDLLKEA